MDTPENPFSTTQEEWNVITKQQAARTEKREEIVKSTKIDKFGRVDEFVDAGHDRKIVLVKTLAGAHDYLGVQEGLVDIIGRNFGIL